MIVNTSAAVSDGLSGGLAVYNPEPGQETSGDLPESSSEAVENTTEKQNATVEPKSFDEQRFWQEIELIAKLGELKAERDDIAAELTDAKGDAKSLKDSLSEANSLVGELESQLSEKTDEFMAAAFALCDLARGVVGQLPAVRKADGGSDVGELGGEPQSQGRIGEN